MPKHPPEPMSPTSRESSSGNAKRVSRRRFGRNAAALAVMTVSPASLLGVGREPLANALGQAKAEDNAKLGISPEQAAEVEAKLANIIRKFGSRLSDDQRQHLRRILAYNERMLAGVHAFSVQNGDPPASVLRVSPMRESPAGGTRRGRASSKPAAVEKKREGAH